MAMPLDSFLVGDFRTAAVLYDREDPVLDVGTVDDQFIRNLVTLRMEERISLDLQLPGALIEATSAWLLREFVSRRISRVVPPHWKTPAACGLLEGG